MRRARDLAVHPFLPVRLEAGACTREFSRTESCSSREVYPFVAHYAVEEETMPCSCVEGCTCANAQVCSSSNCNGANIAGDNIAHMDNILNSYHRMWYPGASSPGQPTEEEEREIREVMRERNEAMLQKTQERLRIVESEVPGGVLRTEHHLAHERTKLTEHIRRLEHEISILSVP